MIIKRRIFLPSLLLFLSLACKKDGSNPVTPPTNPPPAFTSMGMSINGNAVPPVLVNVNTTPVFRYYFSDRINQSTAAGSIQFRDKNGNAVPVTVSYSNNDSALVVQPQFPLQHINRYTVVVTTALKSQQGSFLNSNLTINFLTRIDSTRKFPEITDEQLLTRVQQVTFRYFWDFAHPVSGLARERSNGDNNIVTSGGSGFGIMALVVGIERGFITRAEGLARLQTIVGFLKNTAQKFHGAFPHWLNGATGAVVPFSQKDNGADLVETSFLIQGLLTARQYFNGAEPTEASLRADINAIWQGVEWDWFRRNNQDVLYWHWSPNYDWEMNHPIKGWNECLITYVLAASSPTHSIPKTVYDNGWASNGAIIGNNNHYGYQLPLGPPYGGPLFFSHYSFLGINPNGLSDAYANYEMQNESHAHINHDYCEANPAGKFGYSDSTWGLSASDIPNGYSASSPTNDLGVIAPTAALSSFPYTPVESMKALKFFYYVLGDKIWKEYGFVDAFSLQEPWFADSFLAIDQGPIIVMIENHRTGLLWNLFTSCPEVKAGMLGLGFSAPYL